MCRAVRMSSAAPRPSRVPCRASERPVAEDERLQLNNISQLSATCCTPSGVTIAFWALRGLCYDFVRLFEPLPNRLPPFRRKTFGSLCLICCSPTTICVSELCSICTISSTAPSQPLFCCVSVSKPCQPRAPAAWQPPPAYPHKMASDMGRDAFMAAVDEAREQMRLGEFFEVVLSHSFVGRYDRSPLELYRRFREINPSPYQFYVDYGDEALVGASPEMFVRVENGLVQQRPISGTVPRGTDSLTDYHNMMLLLNSEKEKSELDMLIDLARNDVSRVCEPGVTVSDYRYVEKYSRVMHTVAQVEGRLSPG